MATNEPLLSAIFIIDELPHINQLPWQIAVESTLAFADELVVVHGGHTDGLGNQPVWEYFQNSADPRVLLYSFPWPDDFDWTQIGLSCAFGLSQAKGTWAFRVLADEIFPSDFLPIPGILRKLPLDIRQVSVLRHYMLGQYYACPLLEKPLFFRNDGSMGYGGINILQGPSAMPALFDDPIDTDHWFDGQAVVSIQSESMIRANDCVYRLAKRELPRGYRDISGKGIKRLNIGMLNVDVNFFTDEQIIEQKKRSYSAYDRLPKGYLDRTNPKGEQILQTLRAKVESMITGPLIHPEVPEGLQQFYKNNDRIFNCVREVCEMKYGLPWNQLAFRGLNFFDLIRKKIDRIKIDGRGFLWKWLYRLFS